ncbi:uncharacterized protein BP5553_02033 [Venustampulla echinocandica]|uniref:Uncharacterized protein n=1 Tax=Venustampulla echinocandica TaxID=2656787 RepID=A0A370U2P5_9HELO|nr:uncharacterized protein BP5553_02033 [Venustampulla echinocandica]RDL42054.1 hypothetical protein BP5553_02033 [Venustampulla echinocandica]
MTLSRQACTYVLDFWASHFTTTRYIIVLLDQTKLLALVATKFDSPRSANEIGLISAEVLDSAGLEQGFVRDFLISVRRPKANIKYVAPGLRLPTEVGFLPHPLQNLEIPSLFENDILPIPLFVSDTKSTTPIFENYPFQDISNLPHGLWTTYVDKDGEHEFEGGCKLCLQFETGANGFSRLTEDSFIREQLDSRGVAKYSGRRTELYQAGYNHYVLAHAPQLGYI